MAEMFESVQVYVRAGGVLLIPLVIVCLGIWAYYLRARQAMGRVLMVSREQVPEFVEDMQGGRPDPQTYNHQRNQQHPSGPDIHLHTLKHLSHRHFPRSIPD